MLPFIEPLQVFTHDHLIGFGISNTKYLVGQTYFRRMALESNDPKISILLTPYTNKEDAEFHLKQIKDDCFACIISWQASNHRFTIGNMLHKTSRYRLFFARQTNDTDVPLIAARLFRKKISDWISTNRDLYVNRNEPITIKFSAVYGVIYLIATMQRVSFEIPLSEVEDYSEVLK
ncbi:hypothetical protein LL912_00985 [Niabella sp. CC-SYL272]|uniref:hypothetical protein n=1 Tax=Niabella agricola TaxID=2891571 RepID=UPI001F3E6637|nr:hypothetical protein [Niabella agricola]MCF3107342.1 hypothetical protein [Niabella agricola]